MKWVIAVAIVAGGCGGDDLAAPRLVTLVDEVVPSLKIEFDVYNRPMALLYADVRRRLTRLGPGGWQTIAGTESGDVRDLGYAADGTLLITFDDARPGSVLFSLGIDDELLPLGQRIQPAAATNPFQSPSGSIFVSTSDGGRRLPRGGQTWGIARTLTQVVHGSDGTVFGLAPEGVVRMTSRTDDTMEVILPCSGFPAGRCTDVTLAGRDREDRLYFSATANPALLVLEPGASELHALVIAGVEQLGAVRAGPDVVVVEAIVGEGDERQRFLYARRRGADRFELVDLAPHRVLVAPQLSVDREGTVLVADEAWLGTIEMSR